MLDKQTGAVLNPNEDDNYLQVLSAMPSLMSFSRDIFFNVPGVSSSAPLS